MMRRHFFFVIAALASATAAQASFGQSIALPVSHSLISDAALAGSAGNIAVNNSAGIGNTQANMAAVSVGGELATADLRSRQQAAAGARATNGNERAEISSHAFRDAAGIIAINQSSGNGNAQANLVAIAFGNMAEVSIEQLGRVSVAHDVSTGLEGNSEDTGTQRSVIADSAFAGARGVVQVNQLAGSGNSSANVFALSVGVGAQ